MLESFIKTELKDYQKEAVQKAINSERFLIAMDTGTGKTLVSLALFDFIKTRCPEYVCLVLSTKTGLATWGREIKRHTGFTYQESKVSKDVDISIITPPQFIRQLDTIIAFARSNKVIFIVDECHFLKSSDSMIGRRVRDVFKYFHRIYGLTASPLLNHIEDIFFLFESFWPGIFAGQYELFMNYYTNRRVREVVIKGRKVKFKEVVSYKNLEELKTRIAPYLYRKSVTYEVDFQFYPLDITKEEEARYIQAAHGVLGEDVSSRNFVSRLPQLQLVANFSVDEMGDPRHDREFCTKENQLVKLVNDILAKGESVIVFTYFRVTLYRLKDLFEYYNLGNNLYVITGSTPTEIRKDVSNNLSSGEVVLATAAGGMSINLQAANHVIFFDLPWSVGIFCQSVGRIARIDSKFTKFNVHILGAKNTIDEYKLMLVKNNLTLIHEIIGGMKSYSAISNKTIRAQIIAARKVLLWKFHNKGVRV